MNTYALYGFQESGRSNIIVIVRAETDEEVARKIGGKLIKPTMDRDWMQVVSFRLPQLGEGWSQFQFGNESVTSVEAMKCLGETTGQPAGGIASVQNVGTHSEWLVIARVPFLED
jgi:hypothetical protein